MADDAVKELVAKLKLVPTDWNESVKEARKVLSDSDAEDKARIASSKAASDAAIAALKTQVAEQEKLKAQADSLVASEKVKAAAAQTQVEQAKAAAQESLSSAQVSIATEKAKQAASEATLAAQRIADEAKLTAAKQQQLTQTAAHTKKMQEAVLEREAIVKEIAERSANIKKIQEEAAALHAKLVEERKGESAEHESEGFSTRGLLQGPATVLAGGKGTLFGSVVSGAIGGAAGIAIFEALTEGVEKLTEKVKDFIEDSGGLQKVLYTFEELSRGKFGNNGEEYLEKLEVATHHLVNETDLLRNANTFMESGLKMSKQQMLDLTEATVGLARGQGHDATAAVQALTRTFLVGGQGARQLARIVGIELPRNIEAGLGPLATFAQKDQLAFDELSKAILRVYKGPGDMGQPPLTYTDRLTQIKVINQELFENMAQSVVKSPGFGAFMGLLGEMIEKLGGMEGVVTKIGTAIGDMFGGIALAAKTFIPVLRALGELWEQQAQYVFDFGRALLGAGDATHTAQDKFQELHPVLDSMSTLFFDISVNIRKFINSISDLIDMLPRAAEVGKKFITPYRALGDYILSDVLQIDKSKLRSSSSSSVNSDVDESRLRTSEGKVLGDEDNSKKDEWKDVTKHAVENIQKEHVRQAARIGDRLKAGKLSQEQASVHMDALDQRSREYILNEKQSNAQELGLTYKQTNADIDTDSEKTKREYKESVESADEGKGSKPTINPSDPGAARREAIAEARANLDAIKALADEQFAFVKEKLSEERDANEELYKNGTKSAKDYYATKKALAQSTYLATIQHINDETEATLQGDRDKLKEGEISAKTFTLNYIKTQRADQTKKLNAQGTLHKELSGVNVAEETANSRAIISLIEIQLEAKKAAIEQETANVKDAYSEQLISSKKYFDTSLELIQRNAAAVIEAESKKQQAPGFVQDPAKLEASLKVQQKAYEDAVKAVDALNRNLDSAPFENTQKRFSNINRSLSSAQSLMAGEEGDAGSPSTQLTFMQLQKDAADAQITALTSLLGLTEKYSDKWFSIYDAILQTTKQAQTLTEQMKQMSDYSAITGNVLSAFAKNTSNVLTSRYGRGLESAIGAAGQSMSTARTDVQQIFGKKTSEVDKMAPYINATREATSGLISSAKNSSQGLDSFSSQIKTAKDILVEALTSLAAKIQSVVSQGSTIGNNRAILNVDTPVAKDTGISIGTSDLHMPNPVPDVGEGDHPVVTQIKTAGDHVADFSKKLVGAIGAIGGFINSITSAQSASAGALGGGMSGAGLGNSVGQQLGQDGGMLSSMGQMAGPFGALIGASMGAALGGIMGQKQEEVTDDINQLNVSYKAIMNQYSSNNASLKTTISSIQDLIYQAEMDQAQTKKGGSQFADLIKQYNEQIQQLEDQASQTMAQMQQQLTIITSPVPFQSLLSSVQQVIQQYGQFTSAAQSATDLANANEFLSQSLKNIGQQYTDTLRTDEESAISDALNLNQLYTQRNQLQLQFLQQTESIMGQGTLTRQITKSQSKFSQLYSLDVNHQNQLDAINQQINVAQYKLSAEQQIFNLATTKAGLEQQTLILQEQGINLDMARIQAMQAMLSTLAFSGYSITNLSTLDTSNPNAMMQLLLSLLASQLQNSGAFQGSTEPNGANSLLDTLVSGTYQSRAQYGYGSYRGTNL